MCQRPHLRPHPWSSQVLFTGVVDVAGERVLARLGGTMAKGVADMNCLVTDKVHRTVKFLCALAKGIPVVTTLWLEKVSLKITPYQFVWLRDVLLVTTAAFLFFRVGRLGASCLPVPSLCRIWSRRRNSISACRSPSRLPPISLSYRCPQLRHACNFIVTARTWRLERVQG